MNSRYWACVVVAIFLPRLLAAQEQGLQIPQNGNPSAQAKLVPAFGWDSATQGSFVTSVVLDAQNNVWAGTEAYGLWRYDSRAKKWTQFTDKDGLGDNCIYALAVDKLGRVWAGHLNHGVSVWNGEKWKNYGLLDGPLGDRIFAIATCPTDGDVWIATDCGVARYSLAKDDWDYFTKAGGLPSNQIQAIAFNSKGDIILGTQCDGIAVATAADEYKKWKTSAGPLQMPNAQEGQGLPSSLINAVTTVILEGEEGIMAATPVGMAASPDGGHKWMYGRGADWEANLKGLYAVVSEGSFEGHDPLLLEDWTTCLAQDGKTKNIWIGHRNKGIEVRAARNGDIIMEAGADTDSYFVRAICLPLKGPPLIAVEDIKTGGLMTLDNSKDELAPGDEPPKTAPPLPGVPKPVDAATLAALTKQLGIFKNPLKPGEALFLGDDWRTEGDWVGRYGSSFAMLCGLDSEGGIFQPDPDHEVSVALGPHNKNNGDGPVAYVSKNKSDDIRVLYSPTLGHRTEAEFNDESYSDDFPPEWEGPDLWVDVKVPEGMHCVSLYFINNDSQNVAGDARNKLRDYDVQVLGWAEDNDAVQKSQPLARARVTDFRGGVYKQFVVAGPARYIIRVGRDHSFCTKLQGVFIDRLSGETPKDRKPLPGFDVAEYTTPDLTDKSAIDGDPLLSAANGLWELLDKSFDKAGVTGLQFPLRIVVYRAAVAGHAPDALLATWRWQMAIWTKEDRDGFDKAMADAFKAYTLKPPQPNEQDK